MKRTICIGLAAFFLFAGLSWADEAPAANPLRIARWDLRAGYAYQYTNNSRPTHFQVITLLPSVTIPLSKPVGPGRFEWNPELFLSFFTHPYVRPLIGVTPLQFRYSLETQSRLRPYLMAGAGILYSNINRRETRWDLNFNLQGAAGVYFDLGRSLSLIAEYRHIHISNAGLHEDNAGINTHTFLLGLSIKSA